MSALPIILEKVQRLRIELPDPERPDDKYDTGWNAAIDAVLRVLDHADPFLGIREIQRQAAFREHERRTGDVDRRRPLRLTDTG